MIPVSVIAVHDSSHTDNLAYDENTSRSVHTGSQDNLDQRKRISSEIFYACDNCDGPLIQHTFCRICKKTDLRICLKCKHFKTFGDHRKCLSIVLLDMKKIFSKEDKSS